MNKKIDAQIQYFIKDKYNNGRGSSSGIIDINYEYKCNQYLNLLIHLT
jgi:hypothetical protein